MKREGRGTRHRYAVDGVVTKFVKRMRRPAKLGRRGTATVNAISSTPSTVLQANLLNYSSMMTTLGLFNDSRRGCALIQICPGMSPVPV
jgi:hypothetical protein